MKDRIFNSDSGKNNKVVNNISIFITVILFLILSIFILGVIGFG
jgi:hypothetical protein